MNRRIQVQSPSLPPPIVPAAEPVNTYHTPKIPGPALKTIIDLSPLSETFTKIADDQQKLSARKGAAAGKDAALGIEEQQFEEMFAQTKSLDEAQAVLAKHQDEYAKKIADGTLAAFATPQFGKTFMETVGRRAALKYANRLEERLASASEATDASGNPLPNSDLVRIKAEAWKEFGSNPLLQDKFAQRSALELKAEADQRFDSAVSQARGKNRLDFARREASTELAQHFRDVWTDRGFVPSSFDVAKVWDFLTERVHRGSLGDPIGIAMAAVRSVATQEAAEGGEEYAASFLRNAQEIRVGNTTLGKDVKSAEELAKLVEQYEDRADRTAGREAARMTAGVSKATRDAQGVYLKPLQTTVNKGGSAVAEFEKTYQADLDAGKFGEFTPQALDTIRKYADDLDSGRRQNGQDLYDGLLYRIQRGEDLENIGSEIDTLVKSGQLSAFLASDLLPRAATRKDVSPLVENNASFRRAVSDLESVAGVVKGLPEVDQRGYEAFVQSKLDTLESEAEQKAHLFMAADGGGQAAMDAWVSVRKKELAGEIAARVNEVAVKRDAAFKEIEDKISHGHAVDDLLEKHASVIQVDKARELRERGNRAADKSEYFQLPDFRNSSALLSATVTEDFGSLGEGLEDKGVDLLRFDIQAQTDLRKRSEAWLGLNQDKMTTSQLRPAFEIALRDEILPASQKYIKTLVPEGRKIVEGNAARKQAESNNALDPKEYAESITANGTWNPLLSDSYKDIVKAYLTGTGTGYWGNRLAPDWANTFSLDKETIIDAARTELYFYLKAPTPEARAQAVVDAYSPMGLLTVDNILEGKATIWIPSSYIDDYQRKSDRARGLLRSLGITSPTDVEDILWSRDLKANPVRGVGPGAQFVIGQAREYAKSVRYPDPKAAVDITKAKINGYSTPLWGSTSSFKRWYDETPRATLNKLLTTLRVPLEEEEIKAWYKSQHKAIERIENAR